ncbi:MAG: dUTP diphosphatase [Actinomycetota bacterium]
MVEILVKRLSGDVAMPAPAHAGDAGLDLQSAIDATLKPGDRLVVPTGIAIAIPDGYAGFVQPRSGLAAKRGIGIVNSPGLVDSGYRGEIKVVMINHDLSEALEIHRGDRIAQMVILPIPALDIVEANELPASDRGERGFGSSGRR